MTGPTDTGLWVAFGDGEVEVALTVNGEVVPVDSLRYEPGANPEPPRYATPRPPSPRCSSCGEDVPAGLVCSDCGGPPGHADDCGHYVWNTREEADGYSKQRRMMGPVKCLCSRAAAERAGLAYDELSDVASALDAMRSWSCGWRASADTDPYREHYACIVAADSIADAATRAEAALMLGPPPTIPAPPDEELGDAWMTPAWES